MHRAERNEAQRISHFSSQKNIGCHVEIAQHVQLLVNESDTEVDGVINVLNLNRAPVQKNLTGIGLAHTAKNLHQRGFSRSIFTTKRHNLTLPNRKADILQSHNARKS